jgi:hypothetical protein
MAYLISHSGHPFNFNAFNEQHDWDETQDS